MTHTLPKLPYAYNALEPYIDQQTMMLHHTKHHQAYIDKLNSVIKGTKFETMNINEILKDINKIPEDIRTIVRNHGGGHANHSFFWLVMSPNKSSPSDALAAALTKTFGSLDKFREQFTNAALNRFGSGWAWLVLSKGKLEVYSTPNQDSPLMEGKIPLLGIDVWEHAYYLKYQNKRADYIKEWWNIVNWEEVDRRYASSR